MSTLGVAGFSSILDKTKPIKDQEVTTFQGIKIYGNELEDVFF